MGKLAEFNSRLYDDYNRSIDTILGGTKRVIDFLSANETKQERNEPMIFEEPKPPVSPKLDFMVDTPKPINFEPELRAAFEEITKAREQVASNEIEVNIRYNIEVSLFAAQKLVWSLLKKIESQ